MQQYQRIFLATVLASPAWATSTGLPWENGLQRIQQSATGPVMYSMGGIGIIAVVAMLLFHGEITEVLKRMSNTSLLLGLGFGAVTLMAVLWGASGALI